MKSTPQFLVTVFDALRPDMVTPELAPNLCRFISEGCLFHNSRAVFPTSTYTNAASLATGATVSRHGIVGNRYFDPNVFTDRLFQPGRGDHINAGQAGELDEPLLSRDHTPMIHEPAWRRDEAALCEKDGLDAR